MTLSFILVFSVLAYASSRSIGMVMVMQRVPPPARGSREAYRRAAEGMILVYINIVFHLRQPYSLQLTDI